MLRKVRGCNKGLLIISL